MHSSVQKVYLIDAAERGLLSAGDQVCPHPNHADLILLKRKHSGTKNDCICEGLHFLYFAVEFCDAFLRYVVGPHDDQRIKVGDGEAAEKEEESDQTDDDPVVLHSTLTVGCRAGGHGALQGTACRGRHCPDELPGVCSPVHTETGPRHRSSAGRC